MKSSSGASGALTARAKAARSTVVEKVVSKVSSSFTRRSRVVEMVVAGRWGLPSGLMKSVLMSGRSS